MNLDAAHFTPVVPAAKYQLARDDPFRENAPFVVNVLQEQIDRGEPLREPPLECGPLAGGQNARQQIKWKDPFGALLVAVDGERDALSEEGAIGIELPALQLLRPDGG